MTLTQIKTEIASYLEKVVGDLTVNSQDMALVALNNVRKFAELHHDFEFSRKLVQVTVDGVTGGDLSTAKLYGTETAASVKTVVDLGVVDDFGNLRPMEWTTISESLERDRGDNPYFTGRYPSDGEVASGPAGGARFLFAGDTVYYFPKTAGASFTLAIEAYTFSADWTDLTQTYAPWTTHGTQYLIWASVIWLNKRFKFFVPRTEGNLSEPKDLAEAGLEAFKQWDIFKFEQTRRHNR